MSFPPAPDLRSKGNESAKRPAQIASFSGRFQLRAVDRQRQKPHASGIAHLDAPAAPILGERVLQILGDRLGELDGRLRRAEFVSAIVEERLLFGRIVEEEACHFAPRDGVVRGTSLVREVSYGCLKSTDKDGWIFR